MLLIDHQTGLTNLVHDFSPDDFKNNVLALADCAEYFKLPTILTTSFESGPNGPPRPGAESTVSRRALHRPAPGNINAWDNEDFVNAVKATGKKQLIIAGIVTEVCVAFPDPLRAGRGLRGLRRDRCLGHLQLKSHAKPLGNACPPPGRSS